MYFNKRNNTNIDDEFNNGNIFSNIIGFISKYMKIIIIGIVVVVLLVLMFLIFNNRNIANYLILNGEEIITIYEGADYIEPGYHAYNSKDEDLTNKVLLESNLNNDVVGEYEIMYKLGNITKVRYVRVIDKPQIYTYIYLVSKNSTNTDIYLQKNDVYEEPGYLVVSSTGEDLSDEVVVTGKVDSSKKGIYKLTYSVVDAGGVTINASRKVIVMDSDVSLTLENEEYTNKDVTINVFVVDEYFDYMLLPDNTKVTVNKYGYKVTDNGNYTFKIYNKKGGIKESSIDVNNIDRVSPNGSCTIDQDGNGSFIKVSASDNSGISRYVYNGKSYSDSRINLSSYVSSANVTIYDKSDNMKTIDCKAVPRVYISNISNDGIILTVNAKKVNKEIAGYYFSYTNVRPNKDSGGYLSTSAESVSVVRLPGTTYVWVEDKSGKISESKKITLSNDVLLNIYNKNLKMLTGTSLGDYLSNQGWSIDELDKLMARSVRAAGLYGGEAAATSALSLVGVLGQKYGIKLPYESAGIYRKIGVDKKWGKYGYNYTTKTYGYYGMDCSSFITWAYVNAGIKLTKNPPYWGGFKKVTFAKENGDVGDVLSYGTKQGDRHVRLIIGKTNEGFIVAEASNPDWGIVISVHKYSEAGRYYIEKSSDITANYERYSLSEYSQGF